MSSDDGLPRQDGHPVQEVVHEVAGRDRRQVPAELGHQQEFPALLGTKGEPGVRRRENGLMVKRICIDRYLRLNL